MESPIKYERSVAEVRRTCLVDGFITPGQAVSPATVKTRGIAREDAQSLTVKDFGTHEHHTWALFVGEMDAIKPFDQRCHRCPERRRYVELKRRASRQIASAMPPTEPVPRKDFPGAQAGGKQQEAHLIAFACSAATGRTRALDTPVACRQGGGVGVC